MAGQTAQNVVKFPRRLLRGGETMPKWASMSIREAAERTGYNEEYLRRLVRFGRIEAERIGQVYLIKVESLEKYLAEMAESDDGRAGPRAK